MTAVLGRQTNEILSDPAKKEAAAPVILLPASSVGCAADLHILQSELIIGLNG